MKTYRVEILLTVEGDPAEWDWAEMIELEDNESMSMRVDEVA
jgi:hypothetical protein